MYSLSRGGNPSFPSVPISAYTVETSTNTYPFLGKCWREDLQLFPLPAFWLWHGGIVTYLIRETESLFFYWERFNVAHSHPVHNFCPFLNLSTLKWNMHSAGSGLTLLALGSCSLSYCLFHEYTSVSHVVGRPCRILFFLGRRLQFSRCSTCDSIG